MEEHRPIPLSTKYRILLVFSALLGVILVLLPTLRYGAGLSADSVGYIGTARNLIKGTGLISYDGNPLILQPPLYPILLALVGKLFQADPLLLANIVNAFLFGFIVYAVGLLNFRYFSYQPALASIGTLAILAAPPLFAVSLMAWSETLFILLVILSLLFSALYLEKNDITSLLLLSLLVALSVLVRFVGVALIIWGSICIIVFFRNTIKNRIVHLILFLLVSVLPIGAWLVRNYILSSTLFGTRASAVYTLSQNIRLLYNVLMTWHIPNIIIDHRPALILLGAAIGFLAGHNPRGIGQAIYSKWRQILPIVLFVVIYTAFLVISSTISAYDEIGERLLSPIYIPLTLLLLILVRAFIESYRAQSSYKIVNSFLIICTTAWLFLYPLHNTINAAVSLAQTGAAYNSKLWRESQIIQYLLRNQTLGTECTIYTNGPEVAYILANLATELMPAKTFYNSQEPADDLSVVKNRWLVENDKTCIIWFDMINREYLYTIEELESVFNIDPIAAFDDGAIYSVTQE